MSLFLNYKALLLIYRIETNLSCDFPCENRAGYKLIHLN